MFVLTRNGSIETVVRNSRFLAEAFTVANQEEARARIKAQKETHRDATHVVHSFVIGPTGGILGCSDDGEPSGTAGRPALDVLKGSNITNIIVTIARWFGGTELGTGGLVRAYGDAVKAVIAASAYTEFVAYRSFSVSVSYEFYERFIREAHLMGAEIKSEEFGTAIEVAGRIRASDAHAWRDRITNLSSGRARLELSKENPTELQA